MKYTEEEKKTLRIVAVSTIISYQEKVKTLIPRVLEQKNVLMNQRSRFGLFSDTDT